jgi:LPXTG-motif cell wall-anchored protein
MIKHVLLACGALLLGLASVAVPAYAYPPGGGTDVATDKSSYVTGSDVVITAVGFAACAGQTVTFTITPPDGGPVIVLTAIANADGTATVTLVAPAAKGQYGVVASSSGCANASTVFNVTNTSRLPTTGSDTQSWVVTATALLLTGIGFLVVTLRRRRSTAAE